MYDMFSIEGCRPYHTYKNTSLYVIEAEGNHILHLDMQDKWTLGMYKSMLREFQTALDKLKSEGVEDVYVVIPEDPKLLRFEEMFGLELLHSDQGMHVLWSSTWE